MCEKLLEKAGEVGGSVLAVGAAWAATVLQKLDGVASAARLKFERLNQEAHLAAQKGGVKP